MEHLSEMETRVSDWLKFAEAKNAANVTLSIALTSIILNVFSNVQDYQWLCYLLIFPLLISAFLSMISFFSHVASPTGIISCFISYNKPTPKNLFNFNYIAKLSPADYIDELGSFFNTPSITVLNSPLTLLKAEQVHTLARIAYIKYQIFNFALIVLSLEFMLILVSLIIAQRSCEFQQP